MEVSHGSTREPAMTRFSELRLMPRNALVHLERGFGILVRRLLIMSCGQRKRPDSQLLPALQRYDGPPFHVLRRYLFTHLDAPLDIHILSAKFGLIPASQPIPVYEQRMTRDRARELLPSVRALIESILAAQSYSAVFLTVGRDYMAALEGFTGMVRGASSLAIASGSQGRRLAQLHDWLYGVPPEVRRGVRRQHSQAIPKMRGVKVTLTGDEVLNRARGALEAGTDEGIKRYQSWYVQLGESRISPKWLASLVTGLPVRTFTTDDARRLLASLGITVYRS
jgi:hypothetical protein